VLALYSSLVGFCCVRLITFSLRLSCAVRPSNVQLALASNVFLNAGIPILYIINLFFAQRIIRAQHPRLGWHRSVSVLGRATLALIVLTLVTLIYSGVQQAYTLDANLRRIVHDIQLYGVTCYCFIAFLPLPIILISLVLPKRVPTEKFGVGHFRIKIFVLVTCSILLTIRAVWATTAAWLKPVPIFGNTIPWYLNKPTFYTVQLLTELIVVYMFILVRIDRRFYTPDGIPRGSYLTLLHANASDIACPGLVTLPTTTTLRLYDDDELFDNHNTLADTLQYSRTSLSLDPSGKWQLQQRSANEIYSPSTRNRSSRGSNSSFYHSPLSVSA